MPKTVIGIFDSRSEAQNVVQDLRANGFAREDISLLANNATGEYAQDVGTTTADTAHGTGSGAMMGGVAGLVLGLAAFAIPGVGPIVAAGPLATALTGAGIGAVAGGVLGALINMGVPESEAQSYAEGIRRGGTLVAVRARDALADKAAQIMNNHGAIDIEHRAAEWQKTGWTGYNPQGKVLTGDELLQERDRYRTSRAAATEVTRPIPSEAPRPAASASGEVRMPIAQEEIEIGKRTVNRGGVRAYSYVTETPVEKNVSLREERVRVERRPVDRPASEAEMKAFKEGTVEVSETAEEAVVNKKARVTEEVILSKDVTEHQETVRDKVRRTDVKVEPIDARSAKPSGDYGAYNADFQRNFESTFAKRGLTYEQYDPAYRYGYSLGGDPRYSRGDWSTIEPEARREWESRYAKVGPWDQFKDAVRYAWDKVRGRAA